MGFLDLFKSEPKIEERVRSDSEYRNFSITSFFGAGEVVTEEQAMKVPTISAAIELISSSIAQLPIYLYKENDNGEVEKVQDRRLFLLNSEPNNLMTGHNLKKQMTRDYLFHGASYVKVEKVRNDVVALYNLPIREVSVTKYKSLGYKYEAEINLLDTDSKNHKFQPEELLIILKDSDDGVTSSGILKNNGDTIRLAIDEQDYTIGILKNGALPIGILKATSRLTESAITRLRASWESLYGGAKKAGKTIILEEGMDYHPISMKPNEMDLTNSRKATIAEICRILNVPESMLNSSANKYASNEQNNIYFLQYCLSPIIASIESSLDRTLLLESEKEKGYYFRFDTSEILRTTEKEKIDTTVNAMKAGLFSISEARSKIDLPALEDDYFTWSLGSVFFNPKTGEMTIPNMGITVDPSNPQPLIGQNSEPEKDADEQVDQDIDKKIEEV